MGEETLEDRTRRVSRAAGKLVANTRCGFNLGRPLAMSDRWLAQVAVAILRGGTSQVNRYVDENSTL